MAQLLDRNRVIRLSVRERKAIDSLYRVFRAPSKTRGTLSRSNRHWLPKALHKAAPVR